MISEAAEGETWPTPPNSTVSLEAEALAGRALWRAPIVGTCTVCKAAGSESNTSNTSSTVVGGPWEGTPASTEEARPHVAETYASQGDSASGAGKWSLLRPGRPPPNGTRNPECGPVLRCRRRNHSGSRSAKARPHRKGNQGPRSGESRRCGTSTSRGGIPRVRKDGRLGWGPALQGPAIQDRRGQGALHRYRHAQAIGSAGLE